MARGPTTSSIPPAREKHLLDIPDTPRVRPSIGKYHYHPDIGRADLGFDLVFGRDLWELMGLFPGVKDDRRVIVVGFRCKNAFRIRFVFWDDIGAWGLKDLLEISGSGGLGNRMTMFGVRVVGF
ncbi:hypothetical protein DITRI_Ditri06bG0112800 [Diplodiscus trichospermus]